MLPRYRRHHGKKIWDCSENSTVLKKKSGMSICVICSSVLEILVECEPSLNVRNLLENSLSVYDQLWYEHYFESWYSEIMKFSQVSVWGRMLEQPPADSNVESAKWDPLLNLLPFYTKGAIEATECRDLRFNLKCTWLNFSNILFQSFWFT